MMWPVHWGNIIHKAHPNMPCVYFSVHDHLSDVTSGGSDVHLAGLQPLLPAPAGALQEMSPLLPRPLWPITECQGHMGLGGATDRWQDDVLQCQGKNDNRKESRSLGSGKSLKLQVYDVLELKNKLGQGGYMKQCRVIQNRSLTLKQRYHMYTC